MRGRGVAAAGAVSLALAGCAALTSSGTRPTRPATGDPTAAQHASPERPRGTRPRKPVRPPSVAAVSATFAQYFAGQVANMDGPTQSASAAHVQAVRRTLTVSCGPPSLGYYPCYVDVRGHTGTYAACSVAVDPAGRVLQSRCGHAQPPVTAIGYVDCHSVGPVVTVSRHGRRRAGGPGFALTAVRIAATTSQFCVDFTTTAPVRSGAQFILFARPVQQKGGALTSELEPILTIARPRAPQIELFENDPISGRVGLHRTSTSLLIDADQIPTAQRAVLGAPFSFAVFAQAGGSSSALPGTQRWPVYP